MLKGMVLPALAAALVMTLTARPWRKACEPRVVARGWSLAAIVSFPLVYFFAIGTPEFPPRLAEHWWAYGVGATLLVTLLSKPAALAWAMSLLATGGLVVGVCLPRIQRFWTPGESALWLLALIPSAWLVLASTAGWSDRRAGRETPFFLGLCLNAVGMAIAMSAWDSGGRLGLGLSAPAIAAGLVTLFVGCTNASRNLARVMVPPLLALVLAGYLYAELVGWQAIALAALPLTGWLAELRPIKRNLPAWGVGLARLALLLLAATAVLVPIGIQFAEEMSNPYA